jgi:hypothetical protein
MNLFNDLTHATQTVSEQYHFVFMLNVILVWLATVKNMPLEFIRASCSNEHSTCSSLAPSTPMLNA